MARERSEEKAPMREKCSGIDIGQRNAGVRCLCMISNFSACSDQKSDNNDVA